MQVYYHPLRHRELLTHWKKQRRRRQSALKLGATMEEIMEVLKICVAQGIQASNLGIPILAEELERK